MERFDNVWMRVANEEESSEVKETVKESKVRNTQRTGREMPWFYYKG